MYIFHLCKQFMNGVSDNNILSSGWQGYLWCQRRQTAVCSTDVFQEVCSSALIDKGHFWKKLHVCNYFLTVVSKRGKLVLEGQSMEHLENIHSVVICFLLLSVSKLQLKYHGYYINIYFKRWSICVKMGSPFSQSWNPDAGSPHPQFQLCLIPFKDTDSFLI
jgi:hypothetical protein